MWNLRYFLKYLYLLNAVAFNKFHSFESKTKKDTRGVHLILRILPINSRDLKYHSDTCLATKESEVKKIYIYGLIICSSALLYNSGSGRLTISITQGSDSDKGPALQRHIRKVPQLDYCNFKSKVEYKTFGNMRAHYYKVRYLDLWV